MKVSFFAIIQVVVFASSMGLAQARLQTIPSGSPGRADAKIYLPASYDERSDWPAILLLHGYEENQAFISRYFFGSDDEILKGTRYILIVPEGMADATEHHYHFWNASDACCDFTHSQVDDVKYLTDLVDQVADKFKVDKKRVYATGHSNGAFMAHRLACASSDHFAAIAAFAGMASLDTSSCKPASAVSLLQINAVDDGTIKFSGDKGFPPLAPYPGANESAQNWAQLNQCATGPLPGDNATLTDNLRFGGVDATSRGWTNCAAGSEVRQYQIQPYSGILYHAHTPLLSWNFTETIVTFLLSHQKP